MSDLQMTPDEREYWQRMEARNLAILYEGVADDWNDSSMDVYDNMTGGETNVSDGDIVKYMTGNGLISDGIVDHVFTNQDRIQTIGIENTYSHMLSFVPVSKIIEVIEDEI